MQRLRQRVGHDLLLLPSVAILPRDGDGRLLLVRQADSGQWGTIGGAIELDESPADAARRESREEASIEVELTGIIDCVGGPNFRMQVANGDQVAYVSIVYDARVKSGVPAPDSDETLEVAWFTSEELRQLNMTDFNRELLLAIGVLKHSTA